MAEIAYVSSTSLVDATGAFVNVVPYDVSPGECIVVMAGSNSSQGVPGVVDDGNNVYTQLIANTFNFRCFIFVAIASQAATVVTVSWTGNANRRIVIATYLNVASGGPNSGTLQGGSASDSYDASVLATLVNSSSWVICNLNSVSTPRSSYFGSRRGGIPNMFDLIDNTGEEPVRVGARLQNLTMSWNLTYAELVPVLEPPEPPPGPGTDKGIGMSRYAQFVPGVLP